MPTTVVLTSDFSVRANSFRTIRLVTERPVLSKHALHGTHSKKSVASGRSGICISVVRSFTTRMKAAQHQVARNIRNCKRYYRWKSRRRRNDTKRAISPSQVNFGAVAYTGYWRDMVRLHDLTDIHIQHCNSRPMWSRSLEFITSYFDRRFFNFLSCRLCNFPSAMICFLSNQSIRVAMLSNSFGPRNYPIQSLFLIFPEFHGRCSSSLGSAHDFKIGAPKFRTRLHKTFPPWSLPASADLPHNAFDALSRYENGETSLHAQENKSFWLRHEEFPSRAIFSRWQVLAPSNYLEEKVSRLRERVFSHCRFGLLLTQQPELVKPWWTDGIEVLVAGCRLLMLGRDGRLGNYFYNESLNELYVVMYEGAISLMMSIIRHICSIYSLLLQWTSVSPIGENACNLKVRPGFRNFSSPVDWIYHGDCKDTIANNLHHEWVRTNDLKNLTSLLILSGIKRTLTAAIIRTQFRWTKA